jgi:hypothetical protein
MARGLGRLEMPLGEVNPFLERCDVPHGASILLGNWGGIWGESWGGALDKSLT